MRNDKLEQAAKIVDEVQNGTPESVETIVEEPKPKPEPGVGLGTAIKQVWPIVESEVCKVFGEHWKVSPSELDQLAVAGDRAFPDCDLFLSPKVMFAFTVAMIFGPRLLATLKTWFPPQRRMVGRVVSMPVEEDPNVS